MRLNEAKELCKNLFIASDDVNIDTLCKCVYALIEAVEKLESMQVIKLLRFIYPDEKDMTYEEVKEEMKRLGINTKPAMKKIKVAIEKRLAKKRRI